MTNPGFVAGPGLGPTSTSVAADAFVRRYEANGTLVWTHVFGCAGDDHAAAVAARGPTMLYVVGFTAGTLEGQSPAGGGDAFAARLPIHTCWDTANPSAVEGGPISGRLHTTEPVAGDGGHELHRINCETVVAGEL